MHGKSEDELRKLPRAKLQKLAKTHGIRANLKSEAIIAELLRVFSKEESHKSPATAGPQPPSPVAGPSLPTTQATALDTAQPTRSTRPRMLVALQKPPKGAKLPTGMTAKADGASPPQRTESPPVLTRVPTPSGSSKAPEPGTSAPSGEPSRPQAPFMPSLGVFRPPSVNHPRVFFPPAPKSPGRGARPDPPTQVAAAPQPDADRSISSASRAHHGDLPPVSELLAEVGPVPAHVLRRAKTSSPAPTDHTLTAASGSTHNEQLPYIPDGMIPEHNYSVSTGIPPGPPEPTWGDRLKQFNAQIRLLLDGDNPAQQQESASQANNVSDYQDDADLDYSGPLSPLVPSRAPTDATNIWTPSTPPRSRAGPVFRPPTASPEEMPPYESPEVLSPTVPSPPPRQSPVPRHPRLANERQVKAVVAKMADISQVHKECWAAANTFEFEAECLSQTLEGVRTLLRQSKGQRERMALWLSYRNPDQPEWAESEFWPRGRTFRTRRDEEGREIEVTSEDEAAMQEQGQFPTTPEPQSKKRRRNTPAAALIFGQRPSKKMRGETEHGDAAQGAPAPAPVLGAISEDQEEEA
ncbi:hypothetical protein GY45DRAFT_1432723 [Cubamyces sp. BRFM 1775]|nr:hypothetical protein GY45DRAFT_1432723 [Cubamyces sp. BRFM 1775]